MPHDTDFDHEHEALSEADRLEMARYIWSQENVELRTIGIDIGSSTSHLLFAKVVLQRQTQGRVVPESFTHGTSEQRMAALQRGLQTGDPAACQF